MNWIKKQFEKCIDFLFGPCQIVIDNIIHTKNGKTFEYDITKLVDVKILKSKEFFDVRYKGTTSAGNKVKREFDSKTFIGRTTWYKCNGRKSYIWTCCGFTGKYHDFKSCHYQEIEYVLCDQSQINDKQIFEDKKNDFFSKKIN